MFRGPSAILLESDDEGSANSGTRKLGGKPRTYFRVTHSTGLEAHEAQPKKKKMLACKYCKEKVWSRVEERDHCLAKVQADTSRQYERV